MPTISWNEIKLRAVAFSNEWKGETRERAESQSFWNDFFNVFGINRRRVATFEEPVKKIDDSKGFVDLLWKGNILIEHKSKGKNLDTAYREATEYFPGLTEKELPKLILVSDFSRFRVYDLDENNTIHEFSIKDLVNNVHLFGFIAGYQKKIYKEEDPVNTEAAELMGKIHDKLLYNGYTGHYLEVYLVRLLFCMFADDTGIFEKDLFHEYIETKTNEDGSDLAAHLTMLFQVLNTPEKERLLNLDEALNVFPYINGKLFEEMLPGASFDSDMRNKLIECCQLDWGRISPAIFGSLFQSVMDPETRRNLGAHYTSEKNILKLIKPLFLDELKIKFGNVKNNSAKLIEFHHELARLKFLDPACGCGNFLIITYRELRLLELEILKKLFMSPKGVERKSNLSTQQLFNLDTFCKIDVDHFYGIELGEFPCRIAEVAMWMIDHQMNQRVSEAFGEIYTRLPLKKSANITIGNALRIDWESIVTKEEIFCILGNPPFTGKQFQSDEQKSDLKLIFKDVTGSGVLDYVTAWYLKAALYIQDTKIKVGFVSTNSISQGEQVGILWNELYRYGMKIHFAHRTFKWKNEARGVAAVFVVIIGFAQFDVDEKYIYEYHNASSDAHEIKVKNINPYLVEGNDIVILKRNTPVSDVHPISFGSMPNDGGNLLLSDDAKKTLLENEPNAKKFIKPLLSANQYLNGQKRWCIWLVDAQPNEIRALPEIVNRINKVKEHRLGSTREATRRLADKSYLFAEIRQPTSEYILIPRHSSENRDYIPFGFFDKNYIASDSCLTISDADMYEFGILTSLMHMTWVKYVCGRIKGDYRYSNEIVYNNFPWPVNPKKEYVLSVKSNSKKVLDVRKEFNGNSLSDLYDPLTMPQKLATAHKKLNKAVDLCYRKESFANDIIRMTFLLNLFENII